MARRPDGLEVAGVGHGTVRRYPDERTVAAMPSHPASVLRRQWPFLTVCAGVAAGLAVAVFLDRFRRGALVMAAALLLGAWLRVLLPPDRVGLLHVRRRSVDVATLVALGLGLAVVALVVPPPS